jgi:hypothetical protein
MSALSRPRVRLIAIAGVAAAAALAIAIALWPGDARSAASTGPLAPNYAVLQGGTPFSPPENQAMAFGVKPGTAHLAYTDASGSFFVHQNPQGETCLSFMGAGTPGASGCGALDTLSADSPWIIRAGGDGMTPVTFGLVPDTITTVTTSDGRSAKVTNNVFSVAGDLPSSITMAGPNGSWTVKTRPS